MFSVSWVSLGRPIIMAVKLVRPSLHTLVDMRVFRGMGGGGLIFSCRIHEHLHCLVSDKCVSNHLFSVQAIERVRERERGGEKEREAERKREREAGRKREEGREGRGKGRGEIGRDRQIERERDRQPLKFSLLVLP